MKSETKIVSSSDFRYYDGEPGETMEQHCNALTLEGYTCKSSAAADTRMGMSIVLIYERQLPESVLPVADSINGQRDWRRSGYYARLLGLSVDRYVNKFSGDYRITPEQVQLMDEGYRFGVENGDTDYWPAEWKIE